MVSATAGLRILASDGRRGPIQVLIVSVGSAPSAIVQD
jgi:hypothetical protein